MTKRNRNRNKVIDKNTSLKKRMATSVHSSILRWFDHMKRVDANFFFYEMS